MRAGLVACGWLCMATLYSGVSPNQQITATGRVEVFKSGGTQKADPQGVVVWLIPANPTEAMAASAKTHVQLLQKQKTFSPHVLVVPVGSSVDFPNRDPFFHNVFSLFEGKRFDLGLYEAGTTRSVLFNRAGISYIFCNIHPEMSAVVIALKTPYYAISDRKGTLSFPQMPTGRYELHVWHERVLSETLESQTRSILVSETSSFLGTIRLTEDRTLSQKHQNKYGQDYDTSTPSNPIYSRP